MDLDPITTAMVVALTAGAASGLTETSQRAIIEDYQTLKNLLVKRWGASSLVVQAAEHLETKPESLARREGLAEELLGVQAQHDEEVMAAARSLLTLSFPQLVDLGNYHIQNQASVQGQTIGDHTTITQQFGELPKA